MVELFVSKLHDAQFVATLLTAIAVTATILTIAMPLLSGDALSKRMNAVAIERDNIRRREREKMARGAEKVSLRTAPKQYMRTIVEKFNLSKWVGQEAAREKLIQAGYRGQGPYVAFLFFRMVASLAMMVGSLVYIF